jgi:invasion protein IalB
MVSAELGARPSAKSSLRRGIALLAAASLAGAFPGAALAQRAAKAKYGEWEMRCETPPGAAREQCYLTQSVSPEERPNLTLYVIVLKTADGKSRFLRVIAPLGILLSNGLGLKIDSGDLGHAPFARCLPTGCVAEVDMDDKLIDRLSNGQTATFVVFQTPEEGIGIPMPLAGFKEGFDKLQ